MEHVLLVSIQELGIRTPIDAYQHRAVKTSTGTCILTDARTVQTALLCGMETNASDALPEPFTSKTDTSACHAPVDPTSMKRY